MAMWGVPILISVGLDWFTVKEYGKKIFQQSSFGCLMFIRHPFFNVAVGFSVQLCQCLHVREVMTTTNDRREMQIFAYIDTDSQSIETFSTSGDCSHGMEEIEKL
ncbi:unnamed protein product [Ilex paraguariensis]|uniref:Uncharacterized protein n=1 Tax=Ilex paraguariensis TaxID=185542 RepID=A0ABC8SN19_9AQUA